MKKTRLLTGLAALTLGAGMSLGAQEAPRQITPVEPYIPGITLKASDLMNYLLSYKTIDTDGDDNLDTIVAFYDPNMNYEPEIIATYKITSFMPNGNPVTEETAYTVFVDMNEDKIVEYILADTDGNGTLDTLVNPEAIR